LAGGVTSIAPRTDFAAACLPSILPARGSGIRLIIFHVDRSELNIASAEKPINLRSCHF
jgi:hypothetical protein